MNTNHPFKPCDQTDATYPVVVLHIGQIELREKSRFVPAAAGTLLLPSARPPSSLLACPQTPDPFSVK